MNPVIYFIEDQEALTSYVIIARQEDRFPGCTILAADSIDDAFEWCEHYDGDVIFVVDSRMISELLPQYLEKALKNSDIAMQDISDFVGNEILTGALGTAVLRHLKPYSRIILLTAFSKKISQIRQNGPMLDGLLGRSIDASLSKTSPEALTQTIQTQLMELSRTRRRQQSE